MVDIPPTPKGDELQREMVLRPPQLSLSSAPPYYKGAEAWPITHVTSIPTGLHIGAQMHGLRQQTLKGAQSQTESPKPKHEGQLWGLPTCAESSALNLLLGFLLWVPGEMGDLANQTSEGRVHGQSLQGANSRP